MFPPALVPGLTPVSTSNVVTEPVFEMTITWAEIPVIDPFLDNVQPPPSASELVDAMMAVVPDSPDSSDEDTEEEDKADVTDGSSSHTLVFVFSDRSTELSPSADADGIEEAAEEKLHALAPNVQRAIVDMRAKINSMNPRKFLQSLEREVAIEEVIPFMTVNRDDLVDMLGIGPTSWKRFLCKTGIARWPARKFRSSETKERILQTKMHEADARCDATSSAKICEKISKIKKERDEMVRTMNGPAGDKRMLQG